MSLGHTSHLEFEKYCQNEHISVIQEPGSNYFGHITTTSGTGRNILKRVVLNLRRTSP